MKPTDPPSPKASAGQAAHGAHHHYPAEELHNIDVAHEASDVNIRSILAFAGIVAVLAIVCAVIVWVFFDVLESQAASRDPKLSPLAIPATQMPRSTAGSPFFSSATQPQLVTNEPAVLRTLRRNEDKALHEYGWVDEKTGVAQVPIEQAKKLLVERGLASRPAGIDPALGTHAPAFGESTGGRSIPTGERSAAAPQAPQEKPANPPSGRGGGA
jgi:hypothetical protein